MNKSATTSTSMTSTSATKALLSLARARVRIVHVVLLAAVAAVALESQLPESRAATALAFVPVLVPLSMVVLFMVQRWALKHTPEPDLQVVTSPVSGRWLALNSPASQVPSHGTRAYGQAYAIDLVHEPGASARPAFGTGSGMRANAGYPAFGQPVRSLVDGVVVAAADRQRDHRARSQWWSLVYLMIEGIFREVGGPRFIVGNHVVVETAQGSYALVAHLRRGSLRVQVGDEVTAGQVLGECGNSGNSSEPHVHAQLMDRASLWTANGIPMSFAHVHLGEPAPGAETVTTGLPENGQHLVAP